MRYLVTIDREQWRTPRRWEVWDRRWWAVRGRRADWCSGIGRTVFAVERSSGNVEPLFELPQMLDREVLGESWLEQSAWTKSITRGLRTLTPLADGGMVVNDVFGVYEVDGRGEVRRYVTSDQFSDLHCALPNADNTRLLVTSTGTEEIFEIDWAGTIHRRVHVPCVFGLPRSPALALELARHPDRRTMQLNHSRELFHVNWAQWLDAGADGREMLICLHAPGTVARLSFNGSALPHVADRWSYYPHCHGPSVDTRRGTLLIAISKADEVREVCLDTGKTLWRAPNLLYSKRVRIVDETTAVACDCNGRRLVEIDRDTGRETWSCSLPGTPYDVAVLP